MGQRLNIEIKDDGKVLANAYYHWSGYTGSALELLEVVVGKYRNAEAIGGVKLAVEILASTGAGFNNEEIERVKKIPEFSGIELQPATNRNDGLLSITAEGIEETQRYAEETAVFDIGTEEIDFDLYYEYDRDFVADWFGDEPLADLPDAESDLLSRNLKYYELEKLVNLFNDYPYGFLKSDGTAIKWIV